MEQRKRNKLTSPQHQPPPTPPTPSPSLYVHIRMMSNSTEAQLAAEDYKLNSNTQQLAFGTHLRGPADSSCGSGAAGTCRPPAAEGWWASGGSSARGRRSRSLGSGAWSSDEATWGLRPAAADRTRPWQRRWWRRPLCLQPLERQQEF